MTDAPRPPSERCKHCQMYVPYLSRHLVAKHPSEWVQNARPHIVEISGLEEENYKQAAYIAALGETIRDLCPWADQVMIDVRLATIKANAELEAGYYYRDEEFERALNERKHE